MKYCINLSITVVSCAVEINVPVYIEEAILEAAIFAVYNFLLVPRMGGRKDQFPEIEEKLKNILQLSFNKFKH